MEYFDYMKTKAKCAFKFKEFCDALNKCRFFGSQYNGDMLFKKSDFYSACDKLPPQERELFKSVGDMAIFLSGCGVIL